jgi:hypothetical protein
VELSKPPPRVLQTVRKWQCHITGLKTKGLRSSVVVWCDKIKIASSVSFRQHKCVIVGQFCAVFNICNKLTSNMFLFQEINLNDTVYAFNFYSCCTVNIIYIKAQNLE